MTKRKNAVLVRGWKNEKESFFTAHLNADDAGTYRQEMRRRPGNFKPGVLYTATVTAEQFAYIKEKRGAGELGVKVSFTPQG
ncbi:MAG: hypothetical protein KBC21_00145 [Candidatus Pacebacteria bacterium]|nr:hypothetical protein [Candidatus Paceibacterota bacterium]